MLFDDDDDDDTDFLSTAGKKIADSSDASPAAKQASSTPNVSLPVQPAAAPKQSSHKDERKASAATTTKTSSLSKFSPSKHVGTFLGARAKFKKMFSGNSKGAASQSSDSTSSIVNTPPVAPAVTPSHAASAKKATTDVPLSKPAGKTPAVKPAVLPAQGSALSTDTPRMPMAVEAQPAVPTARGPGAKVIAPPSPASIPVISIENDTSDPEPAPRVVNAGDHDNTMPNAIMTSTGSSGTTDTAIIEGMLDSVDGASTVDTVRAAGAKDDTDGAGVVNSTDATHSTDTTDATAVAVDAEVVSFNPAESAAITGAAGSTTVQGAGGTSTGADASTLFSADTISQPTGEVERMDTTTLVDALSGDGSADSVTESANVEVVVQACATESAIGNEQQKVQTLTEAAVSVSSEQTAAPVLEEDSTEDENEDLVDAFTSEASTAHAAENAPVINAKSDEKDSSHASRASTAKQFASAGERATDTGAPHTLHTNASEAPHTEQSEPSSAATEEESIEDPNESADVAALAALAHAEASRRADEIAKKAYLGELDV